MSSLEDIQKKIEELKQYVTMWERLQGLETINLESLINHKIDSIRDCNQDQSVAGVEKWAQVVKLQQDLRDKSTLVQDSMRKNGLQFEEEPPVEEPPMEEPPVEQSILVRSGLYLSNPLIKLTLDRESGAKSLICMRLQA